MPDQTEPNAGTSEAGAVAPSSDAASAAQPRDERGRFSEYRFTRDDGVPEWAVGRTAKEVATIGDQFWRQSMSAPTQPQQPQRPTQQYGYEPQQPQSSGLPSNDEWVSEPGTAAQKYAAYLQQQSGSQFQQLQEQLGMQARSNAELRYRDEFRRWGPDIDTRLRQYLPSPTQWTPQAIEAIVGIVRGEHAEDLANERAEQRLQELIKKGQSGLGRSDAAVGGTSAGASHALDFNSEDLPPQRRQLMQMAGATPEALNELLRKFYPNLPLAEAQKKWMDAAKKGDVLAEYHVKKEVGSGNATDQRRTGVTING